MTEINIDLVQQAKNDLGERAAEIIANGLGIQKWDGNKLIGCCPFHNESTPSFKWYKKENYFKCFGCGASTDIIKFYIGEGMTFRDATKELFREVGRPLDDDVIDRPKTKEQTPYKQPKAVESKAEGKARSYLELRKISKETMDYAGVKEDSKGNIVFEYYDDKDRLMLTKYRPSKKVAKGENKNWCQKGADTSPILYGMHQIDPSKPLLITEGEIDRLSAIESGFKNAVSVPFGAENYHWIQYNWNWLEQFEEIIVWSDNDEAGERMSKEVVPRLGTHRTKYVKSNYEDINLQLFKAGKESVMQSIANAVYIPIEDVIDMADVEDFDLTNMPKVRSGLNGLDKFIGGFYLGTLNVLTGTSGSGKSTLINQAFVCEPLNQGYKVFVMSGELSNPLLRNWIEFPLAGPNNVTIVDNGPNQPESYYVAKDVKAKMREWYRGNVFFYNNDVDYKASKILKKMEELAMRYGVKVFLLDNLMKIDLECTQFELNLKQKEFTQELVKFAIRYNASVHLVAHPRKTEQTGRLTKMDVAGSSDITNLAHYVCSIHRVSDKEKEDVLDKKGQVIDVGCPYDCIIDLFKNRMTGYQDKAIGVNFEKASKRFYGDSDDLHKTYNWEKVDAPVGFQITYDESCPF